MSLKLFADHCVPFSIVKSLRRAGFDVLVLKDHLPTDAADQLVIAKAGDLDAVLLSLNGDFADIVSFPPKSYKGIITLQIKNHPETIPALLARLTEHLRSYPNNDYYTGKLLIVETHRIRIRS